MKKKIEKIKDLNDVVINWAEEFVPEYIAVYGFGSVFDSNIDQKFGHVVPLEFIVGGGRVIEGWDIGIVGMKVGEKRMLEIAPEFAYGENKVGPIPSNSTLTFEVELLEIKK